MPDRVFWFAAAAWVLLVTERDVNLSCIWLHGTAVELLLQILV